jgi:hypothetical protein
VPVHIGKPEIATRITVCQFFVIHAQKMQNGGMQVVHVLQLQDLKKELTVKQNQFFN